MMELQKTPEGENAGDSKWYCIRSKSKQEHIAGQMLGRHAGVEAFAPRIRTRRLTRRGEVWFVEGLFPGYLFARFSLARQKRLVLATMGVTGLVHFGTQIPSLSEDLIRELREIMGPNGTAVIEGVIREGEEAALSSGPFMGLVGIVKRYMPASRRVSLLLEFMGRMTQVEVEASRLATFERRMVSRADSGNGPPRMD